LSKNQNILFDHFKKELEVSKELLSLLTEEEVALTQQLLPQLQDITSKKNSLVQTFLHFKNQRNQGLSSFSIPKEESQISSWVQQQNSPELHQIWAELTKTLQECQQINNQNGKMIQLLSSSNRAALQVLVGKDPTQSIYGPGSESSNISKFNILG
jgi:flagellar biosynthesis protein FlgN